MTLLGIALLTTLGPLSVPAEGYPMQCDPDDQESCLQRILAGQKAPFPGFLLNYRRAAKTTDKSERCEERIKLVREEEQEVAARRLEGEEQKRENDKESFDQKLKILNKALADSKELYSPAWYETPPVMFAAGVGTTVLSVLLAVKVVEAR